LNGFKTGACCSGLPTPQISISRKNNKMRKYIGWLNDSQNINVNLWKGEMAYEGALSDRQTGTRERLTIHSLTLL